MKIMNKIKILMLALTIILQGCETPEPPSKMSIINGSISSGSTQSSISKSISKNISATQQSILVELKDSEGAIVHQSTLHRDSSNKFPFTFEGEFANKQLWLNVKTGASDFEIALGVAQGGDAVLDLGSFDLVNYSLASQLLSKTQRFPQLKHLSSPDLHEILTDIANNKTKNLSDKDDLLLKKDLLTTDDSGNLVISDTVFPQRLIHPNRKELAWETTLFSDLQNKGIPVLDAPADDYILSDSLGTSFNLIARVYMVVGTDRFLVYDKATEVVGKPKIISLGSNLSPLLQFEFDREITLGFLNRLLERVSIKTSIPNANGLGSVNYERVLDTLGPTAQNSANLTIAAPITQSNVMHYTIQDSLKSSGMDYGYMRALFSVVFL
ncbi:MAG: hypothetical protein KC646_11090 [Candidatus Cloacimonetes bacterium]|nr:hypothetical protein [Candidatus Cloacimonadota bacterium]